MKHKSIKDHAVAVCFFFLHYVNMLLKNKGRGGGRGGLTYYLAAGEIRCLLVHHLQRSSGQERPEAQQCQQRQNNIHFSGGVRAPGTDPRSDGPHQNKTKNKKKNPKLMS